MTEPAVTIATQRSKDGWLKLVALLFVATIVIVTVLLIQVNRRNAELDRLQDTTDSIEDETRRIGRIADRVNQPDAQPSPEVQELFRKIDEIYREVVLETDVLVEETP